MSGPQRVELASPGATVVTYRWDPDDAPRGIVQVAHGMGEHARRYDHLAGVLTARGYVVHAQDHRGHGATAGGPDRLDALGQVGGEGWVELVADIGRLSALARETTPGVPLVLVGHSMGSFALQQHLLTAPEVDAVVLSGTAAIDLLAPALDLDAPLDLTGFNAPFAPARTDYDWLSRDEDQVDAYVADPLCGFGLDLDAGRAMVEGAAPLADAARVAVLPSALPLLVTVGEHDPVNGGLALSQAVVDRYTAAGLEVTYQVWPGGRHEVLNETNRDEVETHLADWVDAHLSG